MRRFEGCRLRIKRADAHRKRIAKLWNEAGESEDLHSVILSVNDDGTGEIWIRAIYGPDLMDTISLELGEMLYQLRAALDGCVYQAAVFKAKKDPPPNENLLEFPVYIDPDEFDKRGRKRIKVLPPELQDLVERVQPYNTPKLAPEDMVFNFNRAIGILSDWARKDRHRRMHVVGSYVISTHPMLRLPTGVNLESIRVAESAGLLVDQGKVAEFRLSGYKPGMKVQANPDAAIDIAVNEVPPPCADNDTLSNRIESMFMTLYCMIETFEEFF